MIDEKAWKANPKIKAFWKDGKGYVFALDGRSDLIFVAVKDGALDLQTQRSSGHRDLAATFDT